MKIFTKYILIIFSLPAIWAANTEAAVRVYAQADFSKDIYVGERFGYYIVIEGANKAGQVDLSNLQKFNPTHTGNKTHSSTQYINNRVIRTDSIIMTYSLTAGSVGQIEIPSIAVNVEGKTYQTNALTVNILKPGTTDQLELIVSLSEKQCYVGQPVTLAVEFYRYTNIRDYQFNLPVLSSDALEVKETNDPRDQGTEYRTTRNGRQAVVITFSRILIPKYAGEIHFGSFTVSAEIAVGKEQARDDIFSGFLGPRTRSIYKRFTAKSEPLSLTVLELPQEEQPGGFYGLVGRYDISASATPTEVNVGDPITLTIKIKGDNFLELIQWPNLSEIPELNTHFKIPTEQASPTIENGQKVFTQTIRAANDSVTEIPPIPLAYFDADKGEYKIAQTKPIKLEVSPTKILTTSDLEGSRFDTAAVVNKEVQALQKGLSANYEGRDALINQRFSLLSAAINPVYASIWAGPLSLMILTILIKLFTHTTPEKIAAKQKRSAAGKAIRQLKHISSVKTAQQYEQLTLVMKQYLGTRFGRTAGSLIPRDCYEIIIESTDDTSLAETYQDLLSHCEAARYSTAKDSVEILSVGDVVKLIREIEKKAKK